MKDKRDILQEPSQKVLFMYQAVLDMINEGKDITSFKVSDITSRAGIGKGTAYEYFETKEEIILYALLYQMNQYLDFVSTVTNSNRKFKEKIFDLLQYGIENFNEGRMFLQILKISLGILEVPDTLKEQFQMGYEAYICQRFYKIMDLVMQAGVEEKVLKECDLKLYRCIFHSQIITLMMILHGDSTGNKTFQTTEEMKEFIYHNMLIQLG